MAWKFVPTDDHSLDYLLKWRRFFVDDLAQAEKYLDHVKKMVVRLKMKGPNRDWILTIAKRDVETSKYNLMTCDEAIKIAKSKNL